MSSLTDELKSTIEKLEARILKLEGQAEGKLREITSGSAPTADGMRMILMGPPGAGKLDTNARGH